MDNYDINPEWRVTDRRADSHSRAFSSSALGFSIAAHLMLAGLLLVALVRVDAPRPSHPAYLVARIVDRLPGADGSANNNSANAVIGPHANAPVMAAAPSGDPKPAAHHMHSLRSWVEKHITAAKIEARRRDIEAATKERTIAKREIASIQTKPAAPIEATSKTAMGKSAGQAATGANSTPGTLAGAGGSGGSQEAHAAYGATPAPEYPIDARRMEQQGVVTLRVLVSADGSTKRVEVARSSGFQLLDNVALDTVRERWRFIPAMRDGVAVESWVMVPIRFALTEADASD